MACLLKRGHTGSSSRASHRSTGGSLVNSSGVVGSFVRVAGLFYLLDGLRIGVCLELKDDDVRDAHFEIGF